MPHAFLATNQIIFGEGCSRGHSAWSRKNGFDPGGLGGSRSGNSFRGLPGGLSLSLIFIMKLTFLRYLLMLDAVILAVLGVLLILEPQRVETFFHFNDLPPTVSYLIGLWGCVMLSLATAYVLVSRDPIRHRMWIDIGILRALIEAVFGAVSLARGTVNFSQAGLGTILAAGLAIAYVLLYPRPPRIVEVAPVSPKAV